MTIAHHPDDSMLMACAAGSQPEVVAAVVASHLAQCPRCRRSLKLLSSIGEVLFAALPPRELASGVPATDLRPDAVRRDTQDGAVPAPAASRSAIERALAGAAREQVAPGVWRAALPVSAGALGTLSAMRMAPGTRMTERNAGSVVSLVLEGGVRDTGISLATGDFSEHDPGTAGTFEADAAVGCLMLRAYFPAPR
jgi:putative transcriptional regulator